MLVAADRENPAECTFTWTARQQICLPQTGIDVRLNRDHLITEALAKKLLEELSNPLKQSVIHAKLRLFEALKRQQATT